MILDSEVVADCGFVMKTNSGRGADRGGRIKQEQVVLTAGTYSISRWDYDLIRDFQGISLNADVRKFSPDIITPIRTVSAATHSNPSKITYIRERNPGALPMVAPLSN